MGLFGNIWGWIKEKVGEVRDFVADLLGGGEYTGTSVQENVDVEKVLAKFKEDIKEEAEKAEIASIKNVMEGFEKFTEDLKETYPDLVDAIQKKRREVYSNLKGSIVSYAEKHISENDPKFKEVLKMQPGEEKKCALRQRMDTILHKAQESFNEKLDVAMAGLHDELSSRLTSELSAKERQLEKELQDISDLTKQVDSGSVDLEKYENERLVLSEVEACLKAILDQGE